ncbi:MAG: hypothetical protein WC346_05860 [Methanogenium sp.]|jgi:hypothetical protein
MSIFYLDFENGNDSITATPYGWWSVAFTTGSGSSPVVGETATGLTSNATAKVCYIVTSSGTWAAGNVIGIMYFYGKDATAFQTESVDFNGSGSMAIRGDLVYCAWKTITTGATSARTAPGDTIRIAKTADPTSLGQTAKWTGVTRVGGSFEATKNISAMADNGSGSIRLTLSTHTWVDGDIVQVLGLITTGGSYEANGVWPIISVDSTHVDLVGSTYVNTRASGGTIQNITAKAVILSSSVTQVIDNCEVTWSKGAQTSNADRETTECKEGGSSLKIVTAATCNANQVLAQFGLSRSLDLSGYEQISFWLRNNTSALTAGDLQIKLYSDAVCSSSVETLNVPAIASTQKWVPITINKGSALSATVQGISVYTTIQCNSKTFYVDNFIACKATGSNDSLTLQSFISKNSGSQETSDGWWGIQSISGTIVLLDAEPNTKMNSGRGYEGTTEDVITYKRETYKNNPAASSTTAHETIQENGTNGNNIQYQGGYDISTNEQTGETFLDGLNGNGYGIYANSKSYLTFNRLNFARYYYALYLYGGYDILIDTLSFLSNNYQYGLYLTNNIYNVIVNEIGYAVSNGFAIVLGNGTYNDTITLIKAIKSNTYGIYFSGGNVFNCNVATIMEANNNNTGVYLSGHGTFNNIINLIINANFNSSYAVSFSDSWNNIIKTITNSNYNGTYGVYFGTAAYCYITDLNTSGNGTAAIGVTFGKNFVQRLTHDEVNPVAGYTDYANSKIFINNTNSENVAKIWSDYCNIVQQNSVRHTEAGLAWQLNPTNSVRNSSYPVTVSVAKVAVLADLLVTVKAWMKLTSTTNILGALVCKGGQLLGVSADVKQDMATDDTDWHEVTITFTPTEAGVVDIEAWAWWVAGAATESVYIDDMTISQATE